MKIKISSKDTDWVLFTLLVASMVIGIISQYVKNPKSFFTTENILIVLFVTVILIIIYFAISYKKHKHVVYLILLILSSIQLILSISTMFDYIALSWPRYILNIAIVFRLYQRFDSAYKKQRK